MHTALAALGIDLRGRTSGDLKTTCPQCSAGRKKPHDPCLSVNVGEGLYHCHNCGWAGKVGTARDAYGSPIQPPRPKVYARPEPTAAGRPLTPTARDYLTVERALTPAVLDAYGIGATVAHGEGAITFPYRRGEALVNVKYRTRDKRMWLVKGAELLLYGEDDIPAGGDLVWVEGEIDKLSLAVAGVTACVSVPNGAPQPTEREDASRYDYLAGVLDRLAGVTRHIIAGDVDAPGQRLAADLIRRLGPASCWRVTWPDGCKDANETLVKYGAQMIRDCLAEARPEPVAGIYTVDDLIDRVMALYDNGLDGGIAPSSAALAPFYRVKPGLWTLVTGIPSHGKSSVLDWLLVDLARTHGWRFAVCSPENQPLERHLAGLAQLWAGQPFAKGPNDRMSRSEARAAAEALREHFVFVLPDEDDAEGYTMDGILRLARACVTRFGVRGLVIDPWNELEHQRPARMSETEYASQALTKLRRFARAHDVHIWLIAHPTKLIKGADGQYPVPTPYDVSGSAHFRNKADMALAVWRDVTDKASPTQVHIQKVRFAECGEIGVVNLYFDKLTGRYHDYGPILHREDNHAWDTRASAADERDPWDDIQPAD